MKNRPAICHPDKRNTSGGLCSACYYRANKELCRSRGKRWYDRNKEVRQLSKRAADWKRANPEKAKRQREVYWEKRGGIEAKKRYDRNVHYQRAYGLTYEAVEALIAFQKNRCRICADTLPGYSAGMGPQVDHDHKTGAIRGIICHHCNKMLGHAKDKPQILANAAHYLMAC